MRTSVFKVNSNIQEICTKLNQALGSSDRFVFSIEQKHPDLATFNVQKRGLYAFYLMFMNKIKVHGKISTTTNNNISLIELSYTQYFLWKLVLISHVLIVLGLLIALNTGDSKGISLYIITAVVSALAIVLGHAVRLKFKKDSTEYETLLATILNSK